MRGDFVNGLIRAPDLAQVLADNSNAESPLGVCPAPTTDPSSNLPPGPVLDCYSELLPNALYATLAGEMNFRVTARDGFAGGGGTAFDDVTLGLDPVPEG